MPEDLAATIRRGRAHRSAGELDAAIAVLSEAAAAHPGAAQPLCERGAVRLLQHRFDEALADHEAARRLDPAYPGLESYLAEDLLYLRRPHEALAAARRGQRSEPGDLMHRVNLAHALLLLGRPGLALAEYEALRDERHVTKGLTGAQIVLEDLRLLEAAGVRSPDVDDVRGVMAAAT